MHKFSNKLWNAKMDRSMGTFHIVSFLKYENYNDRTLGVSSPGVNASTVYGGLQLPFFTTMWKVAIGVLPKNSP
jgi:hypothetical protein